MTQFNDVFIPPVTVRQALEKAFNDNWDNRRIVIDGDSNQKFTVSITYAITVPMEVAKQALADMGLNEKQQRPRWKFWP